MEPPLAWTWDQTQPYYYFPGGIIDNLHEIQVYSMWRDTRLMKVVRGDQPLAQNKYHCWTICVQNVENAEVMIGVAKEEADFEFDWNLRCRLGKDEHSWALSCGGWLCHNNTAIINDNYRVFPKDHVTVHLDLTQGTLMFAINSRLIGCYYTNIPRGANLYPVLGFTQFQNVHMLVSAHTSEPSLQLMSLVAYIKQQCRMASPKKPGWKRRMPSGCCFEWGKATAINRSKLPPGLVRVCSRLYPWFAEDFRIKKPCTRAQSWRRDVMMKELVPPKVLRLADPFEPLKSFSPIKRRKGKRRIKRRSCQCDKNSRDELCPHEKVFRFMRKREIGYISSSDDEIFPEATKKMKARERKRKRR